MMKLAEKSNLIPEDMYGGCRCRSTHQALLLQCVIESHNRITNTPSMVISLDASKCFDRVPHSLIQNALCRFGLDQQCAVAIRDILHHTSHRVSTDGITSAQSLKALDHEHWSGVGQGSGAARAIWCFISSIMEKIANNYLKPIYIKSITHTESKLLLISFIDDVNTNLQFRRGSSDAEIIGKAEELGILWDQILSWHGECFQRKNV